MTTSDKRKHPRIASMNLSYVCLDDNRKTIKQGMGRTLNVSESGILLETHFPIDSGNTVLLDLGLEEDIVEIRGKPVHIRQNEKGKYEIGIQFLETEEKIKKILAKFIKAANKK